MYTLFFSSKGIVHVGIQTSNKAAKSADYKLHLEQVKENLGVDVADIVIHDDNAPIYKSRLMQKFYKESGIERLTHPRYSPDLAPNDFWLIRKLKRSLSTEIIKDDSDLFKKFVIIFNEIPISEFEKCFQEWLNRMQRCINENGNYLVWKKRVIKRKFRMLPPNKLLKNEII